MLKAPPSFVTNIGAWEYTLAKLKTLDEDKPKPGKPRLDASGNPTNYGQAVAIYKAVCKKYPAFQRDNLNVAPIKIVHGQKLNRQYAELSDVIEAFPVGTLFWYDDVLCEAVAYGSSGVAVYPDDEGNLFIRGRVEDVDEFGQHKNWPVGKINGFPPHRCAHWSEA